MRTFLGYVTIAGVAAACYVAALSIPLYMDHFEVQDICNSAFNKFKDHGAEGTKGEILRKLNAVPWAVHLEEDEGGEQKEVAGLGLTEDEVIVDYDENTKMLNVHLEYTRTVVLKPSQKTRSVKFTFHRRERPPNM
jgi:hypothetical protein